MVDRGMGSVLSTTLEDKSQHTTCAFKTAIANHALKLVLGFVVWYILTATKSNGAPGFRCTG